MLREISQLQKDSYCIISLIQGPWSRKIHRDRKQNKGYQGLREERKGVGINYLRSTEFVWVNEKYLKTDSGDGSTTL